jgi:RNA polymerase sigma-70 factor (ECF subfamily)
MFVEGDPILDRSSEQDAIRGAAAGSLDALGRLYELHADDVLTAAYRVTGSRADAEDVLQDVFVGLPRALRAYTERGQFAAWLKRVAVRTALMRMRGERRRREEPMVTDRGTEHVEPGGAGASAADNLETGRLARLDLDRAPARLPEPLRLVFVLKEIEGYEHAEIGDLLGITTDW